MVKGLSVFGYLMPRKRVYRSEKNISFRVIDLLTQQDSLGLRCHVKIYLKEVLSSELSLLWCECHSLKSRFKGTQSILDHRHEMQQNIKHLGKVLWFLNLYLRGFGDTSLTFHHHLGWPTGGLRDKQFAISSMQSITSQPLVGGFNPFEKYSSNWIISQVGVKIKKVWNHHLDLNSSPVTQLLQLRLLAVLSWDTKT